jgi:hypothetical protein
VTIINYQYSPILSTVVLAISRKLSVAINTIVKPLVERDGKYEGKIKIIFRNQVQPWHGSSTFTHEAGLAVRSSSLDSAIPGTQCDV